MITSMKMKLPALALTVMLPAALLCFSSCSTAPKGETTGSTAVQPGVPGGVRLETYQETATITGIDKPNRKVTLVDPQGVKTTLKAGPDVVNFDQLQIGDQVKATATEQLVVFVRQPGEAAGDGAAAAVALAPVGAKPGAVLAATVEVTAKVKAIDVKHRKATLLFPDGTTKTFKVRPDVDLEHQTVGAEVVLRATESVAIRVEKP